MGVIFHGSKLFQKVTFIYFYFTHFTHFLIFFDHVLLYELIKKLLSPQPTTTLRRGYTATYAMTVNR